MARSVNVGGLLNSLSGLAQSNAELRRRIDQEKQRRDQGKANKLRTIGTIAGAIGGTFLGPGAGTAGGALIGSQIGSAAGGLAGSLATEGRAGGVNPQEALGIFAGLENRQDRADAKADIKDQSTANKKLVGIAAANETQNLQSRFSTSTEGLPLSQEQEIGNTALQNRIDQINDLSETAQNARTLKNPGQFSQAIKSIGKTDLSDRLSEAKLAHIESQTKLAATQEERKSATGREQIRIADEKIAQATRRLDIDSRKVDVLASRLTLDNRKLSAAKNKAEKGVGKKQFDLDTVTRNARKDATDRISNPVTGKATRKVTENEVLMETRLKIENQLSGTTLTTEGRVSATENLKRINTELTLKALDASSPEEVANLKANLEKEALIDQDAVKEKIAAIEEKQAGKSAANLKALKEVGKDTEDAVKQVESEKKKKEKELKDQAGISQVLTTGLI